MRGRRRGVGRPRADEQRAAVGHVAVEVRLRRALDERRRHHDRHVHSAAAAARNVGGRVVVGGREHLDRRRIVDRGARVDERVRDRTRSDGCVSPRCRCRRRAARSRRRWTSRWRCCPTSRAPRPPSGRHPPRARLVVPSFHRRARQATPIEISPPVPMSAEAVASLSDVAVTSMSPVEIHEPVPLSRSCSRHPAPAPPPRPRTSRSRRRVSRWSRCSRRAGR